MYVEREEQQHADGSLLRNSKQPFHDRHMGPLGMDHHDLNRVPLIWHMEGEETAYEGSFGAVNSRRGYILAPTNHHISDLVFRLARSY